MKKILYIVIAAVAFTSCEEVIPIDLDNSDPVLVVEGNVNTDGNPYNIRLTRSMNYFQDNSFPAVTGATVTITDDLGASETLTETSPGIYTASSLTGMPWRKYTLYINDGGDTYSATAKMQNVVPIDTLKYRYQDDTHPFLDSGYYVSVGMTDPLAETNFYQFRVYRNGELYDKTINHDTYDDFQIEGNYLEAELFQYAFELGDTVEVELISFDRITYDYFITLIEVNASNNQSTGAIPQNPPTNISGSALGFFGAFATDRKTIIIQ